MAEVKVYSLTAILSGAVLPTGEMPAEQDMTPLCRTYRDSVEFTEDDAEMAEEYCDQDDDAIITLVTQGKKTIKFSTFDYSPETLVKLKGGTVLNGSWSEPVNMPEIYQAITLETTPGSKFHFPKCRVLTKFNTKLKKKELALLEVTLKPQSPAPGKSSVKFEKPA